MTLFKAEARKLYIKRYFLLITVILFVSEGLIAFVGIKRATALDGYSLQVFKQYINQFAGEISEEKKQEIERLNSENTKLRSETEALDSKYANDKITEKEYTEKIGMLNERSRSSAGFYAFYSVYQTALANGLPIVDTTAWERLLNRESIDVLLVIAVILSVILIRIFDSEIGLDILRRSAKYGKDKLKATQVVLIIGNAVSLCIAVYAIRFLVHKLGYGLDGFSAPISSVDGFTFNQTGESIISVFIKTVLIKALGSAFLAVAALTIGTVIKSSLGTAFLSICLVFLPNYIFADSKLMYFLPLPSSLLTATGYFKPEIIGTETSVGSLNFTMGGHTQKELIAFAIVTAATFAVLLCGSLRDWRKS